MERIARTRAPGPNHPTLNSWAASAVGLSGTTTRGTNAAAPALPDVRRRQQPVPVAVCPTSGPSTPARGLLARFRRCASTCSAAPVAEPGPG
jgi:hypothetical protein